MIQRMIAIDWGSTNLRAWLLEGEKHLDFRASEWGISRLNGRSPKEVLLELTKGWDYENTPTFMAGMVGSNVGWLHAPYLQCPAELADISQHLTQLEENLWIIPGLSIENENNFNVMRGEETQLLGANVLAESNVYVMPGTHSKWVYVQNNQIVDFRTVMTGELYDVLMKHTLIAAGLPEQEKQPQIFEQGLQKGFQNTEILPCLFEVRGAHVLGHLAREYVSEYLSGLLIGSEIATMCKHIDAEQDITIVANSALSERYQHGLKLFGRKTHRIDGEDAFLMGIRSIANAIE